MQMGTVTKLNCCAKDESSPLPSWYLFWYFEPQVLLYPLCTPVSPDMAWGKSKREIIKSIMKTFCIMLPCSEFHMSYLWDLCLISNKDIVRDQKAASANFHWSQLLLWTFPFGPVIDCHDLSIKFTNLWVSKINQSQFHVFNENFL